MADEMEIDTVAGAGGGGRKAVLKKKTVTTNKPAEGGSSENVVVVHHHATEHHHETHVIESADTEGMKTSGAFEGMIKQIIAGSTENDLLVALYLDLMDSTSSDKTYPEFDKYMKKWFTLNLTNRSPKDNKMKIHLVDITTVGINEFRAAFNVMFIEAFSDDSIDEVTFECQRMSPEFKKIIANKLKRLVHLVPAKKTLIVLSVDPDDYTDFKNYSGRAFGGPVSFQPRPSSVINSTGGPDYVQFVTA